MTQTSTIAARKWLPSDYQDESIPHTRDTPEAWLKQGPDGTWHLIANALWSEQYEHDGDDKADRIGDPLKDGDVVKFDWTEQHGRAALIVKSDGTWECDREMPATPGGYMLVCEQGCWELATDTLEDYAKHVGKYSFYYLDKPLDLVFYAWSMAPVLFEFQNGKLIERGAAN